jgi:hypothetical protein
MAEPVVRGDCDRLHRDRSAPGVATTRHASLAGPAALGSRGAIPTSIPFLTDGPVPIHMRLFGPPQALFRFITRRYYGFVAQWDQPPTHNARDEHHDPQAQDIEQA